MTTQQPLQEQHASIAALCQRFHVHRPDLFGSAAERKMHEGSDIDFLVEFDRIAAGGYAHAHFGLLKGLQALLRAPVDLVVASAIRNPYFRQSVERSQRPLQAA